MTIHVGSYSSCDRRFIDTLNDIQAVAVDDDVIAAYTSEHQFNALTVELLKEVGSFVCVAASVLPGDTKRWSRDQAIYGGHLVRLFKLIFGLLDQTCQERSETTFILSDIEHEGGYDVLATGHNLDDEAARLLGNVLHWEKF